MYVMNEHALLPCEQVMKHLNEAHGIKMSLSFPPMNPGVALWRSFQRFIEHVILVVRKNVR